MKQISLATLMLSSALLATPDVSTISEVFSEAKTSGNVKYYFIQTDKDFDIGPSTSANANSIGGQLKFDTASFYGLSGGVTFMTTNPFFLDGPVDTSIIGKDNGARGGDATQGFSVLGEAYLSYRFNDFKALVGRKVIKTPLIHAKEVRMLPSAVSGGFIEYKITSKSKLELSYLDKFKQRTSSEFTDMYEHALGANTKAITGSDNGDVVVLGLALKDDALSVKVYDYYAKDFMNSVYVDAYYSMNISNVNLKLSGQYINQVSIGNADTNLALASSITGGKAIGVNSVGFKLDAGFGSADFTLAYSNVLKDNESHDSLVLPWDGTPLFTNMITSNDLFQSIYGNALKADSVYIGGSQGIKVAYKQKYDSFGLDGISSTLAYLNTSNDKFAKNQEDYNLVLAYKHSKKLSFALKGIWVKNNSGSATNGSVTQLKLLSQYRAIANYKF